MRQNLIPLCNQTNIVIRIFTMASLGDKTCIVATVQTLSLNLKKMDVSIIAWCCNKVYLLFKNLIFK